MWRARAEHAYEVYLDRARQQPLLGLPIAFFVRYTTRQGMLLASAAAFRLFLWMVPLSLIAAGLLAAIVPDHATSIESASRNAGLTGAASSQVLTELRSGNRSWWVALFSGAVLFVWATRTLVRNLVVVSAHVWAAPLPRVRQKDVLKITFAFSGAWLLVFAFAAGLHWLGARIPLGTLIIIVVEGMGVAIVWLLISMRLPDRRRDLLDLVPGALIVGYGLALMNTFARIYLPPRFAHSSNLYGSLGIATVMLAWLLLVGQLIVSSMFANVVWSDYRAGVRTMPDMSGGFMTVTSAPDRPRDADSAGL